MAREIVLDTETTGLDVRSGHRLIEVGCIELIDFLPTGRHLHHLIHPERDIEAGAQQVHGISLEMLAEKPKFHEICDELLDFIGDSAVVAHNAGFDRAFINFEIERCGKTVIHADRWVDTLPLAQKRFPGMHNSLDALCKRYKISLSEREKHGALIDAKLLAAVYLELQGGRERGFDLTPAAVANAVALAKQAAYGPRPRPLEPRSTAEERAIHSAFVKKALKDKAVWIKWGVGGEEA